MFTYQAKVCRIIDGDSIVLDIDLGFNTWLNKQHIRLHGIDTPEYRTRDLVEKQHGTLAKNLVESLIKPGDSVIIKTVLDKHEKFGRILGIIELQNGVNLNQLLIEEKLAVLYHGQSKDEIEKQHLENRQILITAGKINPRL
jgi:micrococcal nuclease